MPTMFPDRDKLDMTSPPQLADIETMKSRTDLDVEYREWSSGTQLARKHGGPG